jgi:predicted Zn-dependent protease
MKRMTTMHPKTLANAAPPRVLSLLAVLALAACSQPPSAPVSAKPEAPKRDLVAEVRAIAAEAADALDVQPLRDPVIEDLRASATRHEVAREFTQADRALQQALAITPGDPELLQHRAEIALQREQFEQAEQLANDSYERGPRLGALCRRNWTTIRLAREMRGNAAGASDAGARTARCTVEPPVRM